MNINESLHVTKIGLTRIRTGVVRIKTESDNHYTIKPRNYEDSLSFYVI